MKDYVLNKKPEPASNEMVWAFDLGKGSIGEAVRRGNEFLHKASLLIPAEFAETKTAAGRRRMWRTRQAHKAREQWLEKVMRDAGIEVLKGRQIGKVDTDGKIIPKELWHKTKGKWIETAKGDPRLEREFPATGDDMCYTSCLLRIKLLRGEKLEPWQVFKAFHSAIQRRGYDKDIPWKKRESGSVKKDGDDENAGTEKRMLDFELTLAKMAPGKTEYQFPAYFDAWKMGLWNPVKPDELENRTNCRAESTRNQIVSRQRVEDEIRAMVAGAAKHYPALAGKAEYLLYGPTETSYASTKPAVRKKYPKLKLRAGAVTDWQGVCAGSENTTL
jgi:CRISPR-associated endonuclease Csn1